MKILNEMEVFQTDNYYIFVKREKSLWWNRSTSEFSIKAGKEKKHEKIDEMLLFRKTT